MKASDLKGRPVVTLSDAAKVGQIDDILFDAEYRAVLGFRVKKGAFSRADAVTRENVTAVGDDAVTVSSPDAINDEKRLESLIGAPSYSQARGKARVVTEGGTLLGLVDEMELDDEARHVTTYVLSAPLWDRIRHNEPRIEASQVLRMGEAGIMIVPNSVAENLKNE